MPRSETGINALCKKHNEELASHPKRGSVIQLLRDNGVDEDDAEAIADAIIELFAEMEESENG